MSPSVSSAVIAALALFHNTLALPASSPSEGDLTTPLHVPVTSIATTGEEWSVKQTRDTQSGSSGPKALASIYRRFDAQMPDNLEAAVSRLEKRTKYYTSLWSDSDDVFLVWATIGTYDGSFKLIFDTTSAGVWLLSKKTGWSHRQKGYTPDRSHTAMKMEGYSWSARDLAGNKASGAVYQDDVTFDSIYRVLTSEKQAIQVVDTISKFDYHDDVSGILGMAFSSRNPVKPQRQLNFFDSVMEKLDEKIFTVDMIQFCIGALDFGVIDNKKYTGDIGYADVLNDKGLWNFTIGGLTSDTTPSNDGTEYVIADTVSPMVMLPVQYNTAYYKQIPGSEYSDKHAGYVFPCDGTIPEFTFEIGGVQIAVPGDYMKHSVLEDEPHLCYGALQPSEGLGFNILGTIAFKSAFVVFDPVSPKIGWAKKPMTEL